MTPPRVTVVIPTHERVAFLTQTLASALWQRDADLDVVVVDDGSRDADVVSVPGARDPRVRILRSEEACGVSVARNRGLEAATGDWVAFLDDDDVWAPTKLAEQVAAAEAAETTWAYAGVVKIDERNLVIGGRRPPSPAEIARRLPSWNLVPGGCSGVIARREVLERTGGFDPRLVNLADWDLWIRLGRTGVPACAPRPLVGYRFHRAQASLDVELVLSEADLLDGRYGVAIDRGSLHHYLAHRSMLAGRRRDALRHFGVAAARGQARGVVRDLSGIAAGRLRARSGVRGGRPRPNPDAAWRAEVVTWIRELERIGTTHAPAEPPA
jgi:glycosyltransferase involved in cell wall biosynthesis